MPGTYVQEGDSIDYTPAADTAAGTVVVQGDLVGVAVVDIAADELGALRVEGVVDVTKTAAEAISAGDNVYWVSEAATAGAGAGPGLGVAVVDAAAADDTVRVKLVPGMAAQVAGP